MTMKAPSQVQVQVRNIGLRIPSMLCLHLDEADGFPFEVEAKILWNDTQGVSVYSLDLFL